MREDEGILTVTVERYGDTEDHIVALIATHPTEGTANGMLGRDSTWRMCKREGS